MNFMEYKTYWDEQKSTNKDKKPDEFYKWALSRAKRNHTPLHYIIVMRMENLWYSVNKPYYKVFPCVSRIIDRIDVSKVSIDLALPQDIPIIEIRLPKMALLLAYLIDKNQCCITVFHSVENRDFYYCDLSSEKIKDIKENDGQKFFKLGACLNLLANDLDLVTRDVLSKDLNKYSNADEELKKRLEDKAVRRGKNGWVFGANLQQVPHIRLPHYAIRWTGSGGKIPKLRPIKGSIVHRQVIEKIPTGYDKK